MIQYSQRRLAKALGIGGSVPGRAAAIGPTARDSMVFLYWTYYRRIAYSLGLVIVSFILLHLLEESVELSRPQAEQKSISFRNEVRRGYFAYKVRITVRSPFEFCRRVY